MALVMYHPEQDALRIYLTKYRCWLDMQDIFFGNPTDMNMLIGYGWELVGEL